MSARVHPNSNFTARNALIVKAAYQATPKEMVAEILDGELHLSPRPALPHAGAAIQLSILLDSPFWLGQGAPGG